jgi:hypothetical protein
MARLATVFDYFGTGLCWAWLVRRMTDYGTGEGAPAWYVGRPLE